MNLTSFASRIHFKASAKAKRLEDFKKFFSVGSEVEETGTITKVIFARRAIRLKELDAASEEASNVGSVSEFNKPLSLRTCAGQDNGGIDVAAKVL